MITFGTGRAAKQYVAVLYTSPRDTPPMAMRYALTPGRSAAAPPSERPILAQYSEIPCGISGATGLASSRPDTPTRTRRPKTRASRRATSERRRRSPATG